MATDIASLVGLLRETDLHPARGEATASPRKGSTTGHPNGSTSGSPTALPNRSLTGALSGTDTGSATGTSAIDAASCSCGGVLHGAARQEFDRLERVIDQALTKAGLPLLLDEKASWEVGDAQLTVSKWLIPETGAFVLRVWAGSPPEAGTKKSKALDPAQVYAYATAERLFALTPSQRAKFKICVLQDAGAVPAPVVSLPELPEDARESERRAWEGVQLLLRVERACHPPGTAVPVTAEFLSRWTGLTVHVARDAIRRVRHRSFLTRVDQTRIPGTPHKANLYRVAGDGMALETFCRAKDE